MNEQKFKYFRKKLSPKSCYISTVYVRNIAILKFDTFLQIQKLFDRNNIYSGHSGVDLVTGVGDCDKANICPIFVVPILLFSLK